MVSGKGPPQPAAHAPQPGLGLRARPKSASPLAPRFLPALVLILLQPPARGSPSFAASAAEHAPAVAPLASAEWLQSFDLGFRESAGARELSLEVSAEGELASSPISSGPATDAGSWCSANFCPRVPEEGVRLLATQSPGGKGNGSRTGAGVSTAAVAYEVASARAAMGVARRRNDTEQGAHRIHGAALSIRDAAPVSDAGLGLRHHFRSAAAPAGAAAGFSAPDIILCRERAECVAAASGGHGAPALQGDNLVCLVEGAAEPGHFFVAVRGAGSSAPMEVELHANENLRLALSPREPSSRRVTLRLEGGDRPVAHPVFIKAVDDDVDQGSAYATGITVSQPDGAQVRWPGDGHSADGSLCEASSAGACVPVHVQDNDGGVHLSLTLDNAAETLTPKDVGDLRPLRATVEREVATALRLPLWRVQVVSIRPGSIIFDIIILDDGSSSDLELVVDSFEEQLQDPNSPLRKSAVIGDLIIASVPDVIFESKPAIFVTPVEAPPIPAHSLVGLESGLGLSPLRLRRPSTLHDRDTVSVAVSLDDVPLENCEFRDICFPCASVDTSTCSSPYSSFAPTEVAVTVASDSPELMVSAAGQAPSASVTILFNTNNWNMPQTITISARPSSEDLGTAIEGALVLEAMSEDSRFDGDLAVFRFGLSVARQLRVRLGDGASGHVIAAEATLRHGLDAAVPRRVTTARLAAKPASGSIVQVTATSEDTSSLALLPGEGGAAPAASRTLSFSSSNWFLAQTLQLLRVEGGTVSGLSFAGATPVDTQLVVMDSVRGQTLTTGASHLAVPVAAAPVCLVAHGFAHAATRTATVVERPAGSDPVQIGTVSLCSQPSSDVTVTFQTDWDPLVPLPPVAFEPSSLVFSAATWDTPQALRLQVSNDSIDLAGRLAGGSYPVSFRAALSSEDTRYRDASSLAPWAGPFSVSIVEQSSMGLWAPAAVLAKEGLQADVGLLLTAAPEAGVNVTAASAASVVPTAGLRSTAVATVDADAWTEGGELSLALPGESVDTGSDGAAAAVHVELSTRDPALLQALDLDAVDTTLPVQLVRTAAAGVANPCTADGTAPALVAVEGQTAHACWPVLSTEPLDDVVFEVRPVNASAAITASSLPSLRQRTVRPGAWEGVQPMLLSMWQDYYSTPDAGELGGVQAQLEVQVAGGDEAYASMSSVAVAVSSRNDDSPGFLLPTSGSQGGTAFVLTEGTGASTMGVALASMPTASVRLQVIASVPGAVEASTDFLDFDSGNWWVPQLVQLRAAENWIDDGLGRVATLALRVVSTVDPSYQEGAAAEEAASLVSVTARNDDVSEVVLRMADGSPFTEQNGYAHPFTAQLTAEPTQTTTVRVVGVGGETFVAAAGQPPRASARRLLSSDDTQGAHTHWDTVRQGTVQYLGFGAENWTEARPVTVLQSPEWEGGLTASVGNLTLSIDEGDDTLMVNDRVLPAAAVAVPVTHPPFLQYLTPQEGPVYSLDDAFEAGDPGLIILRGTNFGPANEAPTVLVGGRECKSTTWVDATRLHCVAPNGVGLQREVTVRIGSQESNRLFYNTTSPLVYSATPLDVWEGDRGTPTAGNAVVSSRLRVLGFNFGVHDGSVAISVGGNPCTNINVISDREVHCTAPVGEGRVGIRIEVGGSGNDAWNAKVLTHRFSGPVLESVSGCATDAGNSTQDCDTMGGDVITLQGRHFGLRGGAEVLVGGQPCAVQSQTDTTIVCVAPGGAGSSVDVRVVQSGLDTTQNLLSYHPPILDDKIYNVSAAGGDFITVMGRYFGAAETQSSLRLAMGGRSCSFFSYLNDTALLCQVPPGRGIANEIRVQVVNQATPSNTRLRYYPLVQHISPFVGDTLGGTLVEVRGTAFANVPGLTCMFDAHQQSPATFVSDTLVTCQAPALNVAGPGQDPGFATWNVSVEVSHDGGVSYGSNGVNNKFQYRPRPNISDTEPRIGPFSGGTLLRINASNVWPSELLECRFSVDAGQGVTFDEVVQARWISDDAAECRVPACAACAAASATSVFEGQVQLSNSQEEFGHGFRFTYEPDAEVHSVFPPAEWQISDDYIVLMGAGFRDHVSSLPRCRFGVTEVVATFLNSSAVRCKIPPYRWYEDWPSVDEVYRKLEVAYSGNAQQFTATSVNFTYWSPARAGTYSTEESDGIRVVRNCPAGAYCPHEGSGAPSVCPPGTVQGSETGVKCHPCPSGTYCPGWGGQQPRPCPAGSVCDRDFQLGLAQFSVQGNATQRWRMDVGVADLVAHCAAGHYCLEGTAKNESVVCTHVDPPVTGQHIHNVSHETERRLCQCREGHFCGEGTWSYELDMTEADVTAGGHQAACFRGFDCDKGAKIPQGDRPCPKGMICPPTRPRAPCNRGAQCPVRGLPLGIACAPGFYQDVEGSTACKPCIPGTICPSLPNTTDTGLVQPSTCPPGYVCDDTALYAPRKLCPAGHFCNEGRATASVCTLRQCLPRPDESFCYGGANHSSPCTADGDCLPPPEEEECTFPFSDPRCARPRCEPMRYCAASATDSTLQLTEPCRDDSDCAVAGCDGPEPCPMGTYCLEGVATKSMLPEWQYDVHFGWLTINLDGEDALEGATVQYRYYKGRNLPLQCQRGRVCGYASINPDGTGPCPKGQFCPQPSQLMSDPSLREEVIPYVARFYPEIMECGNYECSGGVCSGGSRSGQACASGRDCPHKVGEVPEPCELFPGTIDDLARIPEARKGYFAFGEANSEDKLCFPGTYADVEGLNVCKNCTAGNKCPEYGMVTPVLCDGGYVCQTAACDFPWRACEPGVIVETEPCPKGFYCVAGTDTLYAFPDHQANNKPRPCSAGTYCLEGVEFTTAGPLTDGIATYPQRCTEGFYCAQELGSITLNGTSYIYTSGSNSPKGTAPCSPGEYCPTSSPAPVPSDPGFHVPGPGGSRQVPCPAGTFSAEQRTRVCSFCGEGKYNDITQQTACKDCPRGKYMDAESAQLETTCPNCPVGTYNDQLGGKNESFCRLTPPGYVCPVEGLEFNPAQEETALCEACKPGYFCPAGTSQLEDFMQCYEGFYCGVRTSIDELFGVANTTYPGSGICPERYYCPTGTLNSTKVTFGCTANYYCPEGTGDPIPCPPGTRSDAESKDVASCVIDKAWLNNHGGRVISVSPVTKKRGKLDPLAFDQNFNRLSMRKAQWFNPPVLTPSESAFRYRMRPFDQLYMQFNLSRATKAGMIYDRDYRIAIYVSDLPDGDIRYQRSYSRAGETFKYAKFAPHELLSDNERNEWQRQYRKYTQTMPGDGVNFYTRLFEDRTMYDNDCHWCLGGFEVSGYYPNEGINCKQVYVEGKDPRCYDMVDLDGAESRVRRYAFPERDQHKFFSLRERIPPNFRLNQIRGAQDLCKATICDPLKAKAEGVIGDTWEPIGIDLGRPDGTRYPLPKSFRRVNPAAAISSTALVNVTGEVIGDLNSIHGSLTLSALSRRHATLVVEMELLNGRYYDRVFDLLADTMKYKVERPFRTPNASFLAVIKSSTDYMLPLNTHNAFDHTARSLVQGDSFYSQGYVEAWRPDEPPIGQGEHEVLLGYLPRRSDYMPRLPKGVNVSVPESGYAEDLEVLTGWNMTEADPVGSLYADLDSIQWDSASYWREKVVNTMPYLPYVSSCEGFDNYIPLFRLFENPACVLPDNASTIPVAQYFGASNNTDFCDFNFTCQFEEDFTENAPKPYWFSAMTSQFVFFLTRKIIPSSVYQPKARAEEADKIAESIQANRLTDPETGALLFEGHLGVPVIPEKGSMPQVDKETQTLVVVPNPTEQVVDGGGPRDVHLVVQYWQRTSTTKEIAQVYLYVYNFEARTNDDRRYTFHFTMLPFGWQDLVESFSLPTDVYIFLSASVGVGILTSIVAVWSYLGRYSIVVPRPSLNIPRYMKLVVSPAIVGFFYAIVPNLFVLIIGYYLLEESNLGKDLLDNVRGNVFDFTFLGTANKSTYRSGRFGVVFMCIGCYLLFNGAYALVPDTARSKKSKVVRPDSWLRNKLLLTMSWFCFTMVSMVIFSRSRFYQSNILVLSPVVQGINRLITMMVMRSLPDRLMMTPFQICQQTVIKTMTVGTVGFVKYALNFCIMVVASLATRLVVPYIMRTLQKNQDRISRAKDFVREFMGGTPPSVEEQQEGRLREAEHPSRDVITTAQAIDDMFKSSITTVSQLFTFPFTLFVSLFSTQLGIQTKYGGFDLQILIFFGLILTVFQFVIDALNQNVLELSYGWKLTDYAIDCGNRFALREKAWILAQDKKPTPLEERLFTGPRKAQQRIHAMCFSEQFYFISAVVAWGFLMAVYGIFIVYIQFSSADPGYWIIYDFPAGLGIICGTFAVCHMVKLLVLTGAKHLGIWVLDSEFAKQARERALRATGLNEPREEGEGSGGKDGEPAGDEDEEANAVEEKKSQQEIATQHVAQAQEELIRSLRSQLRESERRQENEAQIDETSLHYLWIELGHNREALNDLKRHIELEFLKYRGRPFDLSRAVDFVVHRELPSLRSVFDEAMKESAQKMKVAQNLARHGLLAKKDPTIRGAQSAVVAAAHAELEGEDEAKEDEGAFRLLQQANGKTEAKQRRLAQKRRRKEKAALAKRLAAKAEADGAEADGAEADGNSSSSASPGSDEGQGDGAEPQATIARPDTAGLPDLPSKRKAGARVAETWPTELESPWAPALANVFGARQQMQQLAIARAKELTPQEKFGTVATEAEAKEGEAKEGEATEGTKEESSARWKSAAVRMAANAGSRDGSREDVASGSLPSFPSRGTTGNLHSADPERRPSDASGPSEGKSKEGDLEEDKGEGRGGTRATGSGRATKAKGTDSLGENSGSSASSLGLADPPGSGHHPAASGGAAEDPPRGAHARKSPEAGAGSRGTDSDPNALAKSSGATANTEEDVEDVGEMKADPHEGGTVAVEGGLDTARGKREQDRKERREKKKAKKEKKEKEKENKKKKKDKKDASPDKEGAEARYSDPEELEAGHDAAGGAGTRERDEDVGDEALVKSRGKEEKKKKKKKDKKDKKKRSEEEKEGEGAGAGGDDRGSEDSSAKDKKKKKKKKKTVKKAKGGEEGAEAPPLPPLPPREDQDPAGGAASGAAAPSADTRPTPRGRSRGRDGSDSSDE